MVGVPVSWISSEQIFETGDISGWMPVDRLMGGSMFVIRILPGGKDKYWIDLFIQFREVLDLDSVRKAFDGKKVTDSIAACLLTDCVAWDSIDLEDRFGKPPPGSQ